MTSAKTSRATHADDAELHELLELARELVAAAKAQGATVAECVVRSGAELSTRVRLGEPELVEEAATRGAGLRVMRGQRIASTSTSDLTPEGRARFVQDAMELLDLAQEDPFAGPADAKLLCDPNDLPDLELFDPSGSAIAAPEALSLAKRTEDAARAADARIKNSQGATFGRTTGASALVLSSGFAAARRGSYQSLSVAPIAEDAQGKKHRGSHWTAKRFLAEMESPEQVGAEAARRTLRKLGARPVPSCEVPVLFDPDAARALLGLLAGAVMGSAIWRKSSYLLDKEGQRIASPMVTVIDNPLMPRAPGSRAFDGEGLKSRVNTVVEDGVLRMFLCDSYSARKLGRESTASASRGGGAGVGCATSNFVLQPGSDAPEAIIKGTSRGLYVTEMMGFGYNPVTGDFSRGAAGFWIENGEFAFPVSEVTISLNMHELWQRIDAVGSDLDLRTSIASPTLRVAKMTVAGGGSE